MIIILTLIIEAREGNTMKNDRLFQVLYILLAKQKITAPELAKQLEVSVRTIYRDIETLSMAGIPVYSTQGKGGGIHIMSGFTIDKSLFSEKEQNQLMFALQSFQATDQNVELLLSKLGAIFQRDTMNWIEVDFSRWGYHKEDTFKFEQLKNSILEKRVLEILYCGTNGTVTKREIKPVKLIFKDKNWYVQGYCLNAEDFRVFRINRILSLKRLDIVFEDVFNKIPQIETEDLTSGNTISLSLKFAKEVAYRVYDDFEPSNIETQEDGTLLVSAEIPDQPWIYSYLLSFGTQMEVIKPLYLKHNLASYVKNIYDHFQS